jgi:hypothetical protein
MKRGKTIRDRLAEEAERYLDVVDAFAALDADPHTDGAPPGRAPSS